MHMTQHIAHLLVASRNYLKGALLKLCFHTVMEKFSTFFLPEMDLECTMVLQIDW